MNLEAKFIIETDTVTLLHVPEIDDTKELPFEKGGRFWPIVIDGLTYSLILLPLG